jgi:hypothetical protein
MNEHPETSLMKGKEHSFINQKASYCQNRVLLAVHIDVIKE